MIKENVSYNLMLEKVNNWIILTILQVQAMTNVLKILGALFSKSEFIAMNVTVLHICSRWLILSYNHVSSCIIMYQFKKKTIPLVSILFYSPDLWRNEIWWLQNTSINNITRLELAVTIFGWMAVNPWLKAFDKYF